MDIFDTLTRISESELYNSNLRYCLVAENKHPFKIDDSPAKPNVVEDFVEFDTLLQCENLQNYAGVGISIQASNVCAIDIDHCFSEPLNIDSGDERAKDILNRFGDFAYCEFSFSGKGLRVIFKTDLIENYSDRYYIKNEKFGAEYYQPTKSYRYVTVTGNSIYNNHLEQDASFKDILLKFLNDYMLKPERKSYEIKTEEVETKTFEELMKDVKLKYFRDIRFQDLWFSKAPGSGKDESERDYHLVAYLFENITQNKELIKQIFESSPFYKSKDLKHYNKWVAQEHRYFNYLYDRIRRIK